MAELNDTQNEQPQQTDGRIWWRKTGGGTFRMNNGRIIKPNQKFKARPDEIPEGFRDVVVPLDKTQATEAPLPPIAKPQYSIRQKSPGWYDVVDDNSGKALNEKGLRPEAAKELIAQLQQ